MTRTAAVIVGIDDYADQPLTSSVNDARDVHDALAALTSWREQDVTLLTSDAGTPPTRDAIRDALYDLYTGGDRSWRPATPG